MVRLSLYRHRSQYERIPAKILQQIPSTIENVQKKFSRKKLEQPRKPPTVWFPNQQSQCEYEEGGSSFNAFSLLALVMSATNLVSILVSNVNNNINNQNNNNNLNNLNVQGSTENNGNSNINVFNMMTMGAGKRKRRSSQNISYPCNEENLTGISGTIGLEMVALYEKLSLIHFITRNPTIKITEFQAEDEDLKYLKRILSYGQRKKIARKMSYDIICNFKNYFLQFGVEAKSILKAFRPAMIKWITNIPRFFLNLQKLKRITNLQNTKCLI